MPLSVLACFLLFGGPLFKSSLDIIFSRPHRSEYVSTPLLYKIFSLAGQRIPPQIIFSQNFENIGPLSSFFWCCFWDIKCLENSLPLFETFLFSLWKLEESFPLEFWNSCIMCLGIGLFLSVAAGFRVVFSNLEFISSEKCPYIFFFYFLPFVFSVLSFEFLLFKFGLLSGFSNFLVCFHLFSFFFFLLSGRFFSTLSSSSSIKVLFLLSFL